MATGHYLGDTGDFSNTIYTGVPGAGRRQEPDAVPRERPRARRCRRALRRRLPRRGDDPRSSPATRATAPPRIGKLGPVLIFDHTERTGADDCDHRRLDRQAKGIPLSRRGAGPPQGGRSAARGAAARPQRQVRRARTPGTSAPSHPAGLVRGGRDPRRTARCWPTGTSPSSWCSGRAIPTARSTTRATASASSCRASTGRPRMAAIRNADDDLGRPPRRDRGNSASPTRPTSW